MDYALIAYMVLAFGVVMYVVLDGFDLGIGILLPFARDAHKRELMIASVAPVWDGNETWLVLGGVVLFAGLSCWPTRCTPTGCSAARPPPASTAERGSRGRRFSGL